MAERFIPREVDEVVQGFWDGVFAGQTAADAGAAVGWSRRTVNRHLVDHGGIRPRRGRKLKGRSLNLNERESIGLWRREKLGIREIARRLGRSPSTISREIKRNSNNQSRYRPTRAHAYAAVRAARPKPAKLTVNAPLRNRVQDDLQKNRSPEQIAGRLVKDFPDHPEMRVSHETIYQSLYLEARGGLKRELSRNLRTGRTLRKPQRRPDKRSGRIPDMVMIADRPAEVEDRTVPGHWEGDLIVGEKGRTAIGTIVERTTGYLMLLHLPPNANNVETVRDGLISKMGDLPDTLRLSLTWDQGKELYRHKDIKIAADLDIYFCDPHSPWQRGSNENMNGLLRQYFPKGTDLSIYTPTDLDYVAHEVNDRPRKRFNFNTPNEMMKTYLLH